MADMICVQCDEPWDSDYVYHDMTPQERTDLISGRGCPSCEGKDLDEGKAQIMSGVLDLYGDDLDALAADMDDGFLDFLLGG